MDAKYCVTSVLFRFQGKYDQTSPKLQISTCFLVWIHFKKWCSSPTSSYAKFVESHEHPEALIVLYVLAYYFYKKQVFTARGKGSVNDTV